MIVGAHIVLYSKDADADRAFFKDILGLKSVDAGRGRLVKMRLPGGGAISLYQPKHPTALPEH